MDAVEGEEIQSEVEIEKVEVEKSVKKTRKPMSEETLEKLAKAREKANAKRKEMSEERKVHKETLVQKKMEEVQEARQQKDQTAAVKEANKRVRAKRQAIIIEREGHVGIVLLTPENYLGLLASSYHHVIFRGKVVDHLIVQIIHQKSLGAV